MANESFIIFSNFPRSVESELSLTKLGRCSCFLRFLELVLKVFNKSDDYVKTFGCICPDAKLHLEPMHKYHDFLLA